MNDGLTVADLAASYGSEPVFEDVAFVVPRGLMLAVTGASGAGKSTLLWVLAGAKAADRGDVAASGEPIDSHDRALEAGIALMPQGNGLANVLTATENIQLPMLAFGVPAPEAQARTGHALEAVGLGDSGNHLVDELSGGQQQRVAFARLLAGRQPVLLADEPTSDLDAVNRAKVMELLRARADEGACVVVTTHDPEAAAVADAEIHLDDGRMEWIRRMPA